jgi:hypothetical protein
MMLSEFSGTNRAFNGFLEYNPFNVSEFLTKLDQALSMSSQEKEELMRQAVSYLEKASTSKWVDSYLRDLKIAYKPRSVSYYLGGCDQTYLAADSRVMMQRSDLRKLNVQQACETDFLPAGKCVIFIDHEALPVLEYSKEEMSPTPEVLEDIREIASDPLNRNIVIVFSNQSVQMLSDHFASITKHGPLDNLWLAAESGYLYKAPTATTSHSPETHHSPHQVNT